MITPPKKYGSKELKFIIEAYGINAINKHVSVAANNLFFDRYFKEKFAVCPMLGDLAFVDLSEIDISQIADTLKEIAVEV